METKRRVALRRWLIRRIRREVEIETTAEIVETD
jgi:hypothetical protein